MDAMTLAKARMISEKLHQLILMQVLRDEDLEDIGRIFVRAIERIENKAIERIEKKHGRKRNNPNSEG